MKRVLLFLTLLLSFGILVGCSSKNEVYSAPHNNKIAFDSTKDEILELEESLTEVITKTSDDIIQTVYQKGKDQKVEIEGIEFNGLTYTFENDVLASMNYYIDTTEEDYDWSRQWDTIEAYFTKKYGDPAVADDLQTDYSDKMLEWNITESGKDDCYVRLMVIKPAKRFNLSIAKKSYTPITN